MRPLRLLALVAALVVALTSCRAAGAEAGSALRLGYFPNVTHAPALVGIGSGRFADALGPAVALEPRAFKAGPSVVEALFAGALDAAFIGPNPAVNAYVRSEGEAVRVVAGATSGGAFLVVRPGIARPEDLRGATLATPQIGGTQDVALRAWLADQGLAADAHGGGEVSLVPQDNAQTLDAFRQGAIDGAWVPEPWATRLQQEGGARVLVDERDLWPEARWSTTLLVVRAAYLEAHPDVVRRLLAGLVAAVDTVREDPEASQRVVNAEIERVTGKRMPEAVLRTSWDHLTFTVDPLADSVRAAAADAERVGFLEQADLARADLDGLFDVTLLNEVLAGAGRPPVTEP